MDISNYNIEQCDAVSVLAAILDVYDKPTAKEVTLQQGIAQILAAMPSCPTVQQIQSGLATEANATANKNTLQSLLNGISTSMYKGVPIVTQTTSATISPNTWNVWASVAGNLTITKGTDISGVTNCYIARFTLASNWSGQIAFAGFSLDWNGGSEPTWAAGKTYEVNIVDNIAMWAEIEPAS